MLKKGLFLFYFLLNILFGFGACAENFEIKNYEVYLKVYRNRVVAVREFILADFSKASHGIFRDVPLQNSRITDISIDNNYTTSKYGDFLRIKIGTPDRLVTGLQQYNISFNHHLFGRSNEFYYNIIGTRWPVNIQKVKFHIEMPAPFEASKVGLSIGKYGTQGFDGGAIFSVQDNHITGETTVSLPPFNGITVRLEVPNGYFLVQENSVANWVLAAIWILTLLSFSIWFLYGKDAHIVPVVSFYPPKDTFVREAELVCTEKVTTKSLVATLIVLAKQGYIHITSERKKGFTLEKIKAYDGNDVAAHEFMETLFPRYKGQEDVTSVTQKELEVSFTFYKKCARMVSLLNSSKTRFFSRLSVSPMMRFLMMALIVAEIGLTLFSLTHYYINLSEREVYIINIALGLVFQIVILYKFGMSFTRTEALSFVRIWSLICSAFFFLAMMCEGLVDDYNSLQVYSGIVGLVVTIICYIQLPQLNYLGRQVKGQLLGLKKFIEVAEKKRLELMVSENPEYFYDILPYAYILGVSDKWIKQFEEMLTEQPSWYSGRSFSLNSFNSLASSMYGVTRPSVSNGGVRHSHSHGGGGFSGGGHGGGGGGSW